MKDYGAEMWWRAMLEKGPTCLLKEDWSRIELKLDELDETTRAVFKALLADMDRQTRWILERTKSMRDEAEHIALIGETVKRAGLRSYTDEKGRIYVASDCARATQDTKGQGK